MASSAKADRQVPVAWLAGLSTVLALLALAMSWSTTAPRPLVWILLALLVACAALLLLAMAKRTPAPAPAGGSGKAIIDDLSRLQNLLYALAVRAADAMTADRPAQVDRQERRLVLGIIAGEAGSFLIGQRAAGTDGAAEGHHEPWRLFFLILDRILMSTDLRGQACELIGLLDLLDSVDERQVADFVLARQRGEPLRMTGAAIRDDAGLRVLRARAAQVPGQADLKAERFLAGFDPDELEAELAYLGENSLERRVYDSARRQSDENPALRVVLAGVVDRILEGRRARLSLFGATGDETAAEATHDR